MSEGTNSIFLDDDLFGESFLVVEVDHDLVGSGMAGASVVPIICCAGGSGLGLTHRRRQGSELVVNDVVGRELDRSCEAHLHLHPVDDLVNARVRIPFGQLRGPVGPRAAVVGHVVESLSRRVPLNELAFLHRLVLELHRDAAISETRGLDGAGLAVVGSDARLDLEIKK